MPLAFPVSLGIMRCLWFPFIGVVSMGVNAVRGNSMESVSSGPSSFASVAGWAPIVFPVPPDNWSVEIIGNVLRCQGAF